MSVYGTLLRVSSFGESHGPCVGCVIDGLPPSVHLSTTYIQKQLDRRKPGQSVLTTQRKEQDIVDILSGVENGLTLGTPITLCVNNHNYKPSDYYDNLHIPRPGHGDYTYIMKYGIKALSGGGRASARETIARVAAGAVAEKWLADEFKTEIVAWVNSIMDISLPPDIAKIFEDHPPSRDDVDKYGTLDVLHNGDFKDLYHVRYSASTGEAITKGCGEIGENLSVGASSMQVQTRCPHSQTAAKMAAKIMELRKEEDSTGGIVTCVIKNCPVGLGEPCFDKVEAELAKAMMSIPSVKGFEIGSGFRGTAMRGSDHNDMFVNDDIARLSNVYTGRPLLNTATNNAGGTLAGITVGTHIVFRVAMKPASSIGKKQKTCSFDGEDKSLIINGRHDPCVLPRSPPIIEGMAALVIADLALRQRARVGVKYLDVLI